ncbi:MAG: 4-hydroxy-3-methylbut-2-enyl diphosphate reductase [Bacteroidota bacterium]|nr:4-hydroxy-3-methylbut-2-enyl diphosphate reductase [Bacteroidota bacterium]
MQIFLSSKIGLCFGVKRALRLTREELNKGRKVYLWGDLVHNPQIMQDLKQRGAKVVSNLSEIKKGSLVTRSHGVDPHLIKEAKLRGLKVVDTTCPYVQRVHEVAKKLFEDSYKVVIIGLKSHPEVRGVIAGIGKEKVFIVRDPQEVEKIPSMEKIGVIVQTTETLDNFKNIVKNLVEKAEECKVFNTICKVIRERQKATESLAKKVEAVIVVGGYNSSNTQKLVKICQSLKVKTYFIEKDEDLKVEEWKNFKKIGITGGTSTPFEVVERTKRRLLSMIGEKGV